MSRAALLVHGRDGARALEPLAREELEGLARRLVREGGAASRLAWERTGLLDARPLLETWRRQGLLELPPPRSALLRSGRHFATGLRLQVETTLEAPILPAAAAALAGLIRRRGSPLEVAATVVADPGPVPGRAIEAEDLPWILAGETLWSPRLGRCRVKRVTGGGARFLLRAPAGEEFERTAAELVAGFRRLPPGRFRRRRHAAGPRDNPDGAGPTGPAREEETRRP
ncbi:MAG: hypothetical protein D6702_05040 [Planctomycetota bacterium]|nr:MAG: hypothetical protein D6702_05040 [Planctomycetota bacterium]